MEGGFRLVEDLEDRLLAGLFDEDDTRGGARVLERGGSR